MTLRNANESKGHGGYQIAYLLGRIAEYTGSGDLIAHALEQWQDRTLISEYEAAVANVESWQTKEFGSLWAFRSFRIAMAALIRDRKSNLVVETGVLHGMTSGFLLEAMHRNGRGTLMSIDLPSYHESGPANHDGYDYTLPKGKEPGWMIPERLRSRWDLRLGASVDVLRALEGSIGDIDIFCHDSEHIYATMWQELTFAWDRLVQGGILFCDNIEANPSFFDFCRRVGRLPLVLPTPSEDMSYAPRFALIVR